MNTQKQVKKIENQINQIKGQVGHLSEKKKNQKSKGTPMKKVKKLLGRIYQGPHEQSDIVKLEAALHNAFKASAEGARLIGEFAVATIPLKLRGKTFLNPDAFGNISLMLTSHPFLPMVIFTGTVVTSPFTQFAANGGCWNWTSPSQLSSSTSSWRVVSGHHLVKVNMGFNNVTGDVIAAVMPGVNQRFLTYEFLSGTNISLNRILQAACGLGLGAENGTLTTAIEELPEVISVTCGEMTQKDLLLRCNPCSPNAYEFQASQQFNTTTSAGSVGIGDASTETAASLVGIEGINTINFAGHTVQLLQFSGIPTGITTGAISIEHIFRGEGTPQLRIDQAGQSASVAALPICYDAIRAVCGSRGRQIVSDFLVSEPMISFLANGAQTLGQALFGDRRF